MWSTLEHKTGRAPGKQPGTRRAEHVFALERQRRLEAERKSRNLSQLLLVAHEEERRRLARELHDDVTQRLARLAIDAARGERGGAGAAVSGAWRRMREELVRLSEDVHTLAHRLHPSALEELGLVAALQAECDRFSQLESIQATVTTRDLPRKMSRETALCLFRISQEALRNVARHAHATAVKVYLAGMDDGLQLSVQDNGTGFNPVQARRHCGLGLVSMNERVDLLKGELEIKSAPDHGTTVLVWVPLKTALHP